MPSSRFIIVSSSLNECLSQCLCQCSLTVFVLLDVFQMYSRCNIIYVFCTKRKERGVGWGRKWMARQKTNDKQAKSLRHREFPGGPPSKYYPGPTMLNFRDQTRTGVFIVVWSQAEIVCLSFLLFYIQQASEQTVEIGLALHPLFLSPCFSNKM